MEAKIQPRAVILKVCDWIREIYKSNEYFNNIICLVCDLLELYPEGNRTPRLQESITPLKQKMADLTNMIGIRYFDFDSQGPYYSELKTKGNSHAIPKIQILRRVRTILRSMYPSLLDSSTLCGGITDIKMDKNCSTYDHEHQPDILTQLLAPFSPSVPASPSQAHTFFIFFNSSGTNNS